MSKLGQERLAFAQKLAQELQEQTESGQADALGITRRRYERVLAGVDKVLKDHEADLIAGEPYSEIVLWALDIIGFDVSKMGWDAQERYNAIKGY